MLEVDGLAAGYGRLTILRDVGFEVAPMSVVAVVGSNGAGKTTLLRCVSGLIEAREGSVLWEGADITAVKPWRRVEAGIAHVPEGRQVFPTMTVAEHLTLAGELAPDVESRFDLDFVYELFPKLDARRGQEAGTLSGGEQQMLAIGRALMSRPRLLLLDEPSHGLAPIVVDQLSELVARVADHISILLIEQNLSLPRRIADHAVVLENGRIVRTGSADEILADEHIKDIYLGTGG